MPGTFTYNAGTNTITVTGGTPGSPADFASMYAADQAGGWGKVHQYNSYQYQIDGNLNIGDGSPSTFFQDTNKQIVFGSVAAKIVLMIKANATFQLGQLVSGQYIDGCGVILNAMNSGDINNSNGTFKLYASLWNQISGLWNGFILNGPIDIQNSNIIADQFTLNSSCSGSINNLIVIRRDTNNAGIAISSVLTVSNLTVLKLSAAPHGEISFNWSAIAADHIVCNTVAAQHGAIVSLIDSQVNYFVFIDTAGGEIFNIKYTYNLLVTDKDGNPISGATVDLKDNTGASVTGFPKMSGADGRITATIVTVGYYDLVHGNNNFQTYGPHTLTITADNYQDYQDVITIDQKMNLEVAMLGAVAGGGGVPPANPGLVPLGIKQVAV